MATISGKIHNALGEPAQVSIEFETVSAPVLGSDYVVGRTKKTVSSDGVGAFSVSLEAGDYFATWFIGTVQTRVRFSVPDADITYQFRDLITDAVVFTYTVQPQYVLASPPNGSFRIKNGQHIQLWNPTTLLWHTIIASGPDGALQISLAEGEA